MKKKVSSYRADIDGLRAVAVLLVVVYHVGFKYLSGGYVGVDVFFVISGYLITLHIASELEAGTFSLASFYERRIRRIFPALLGMILVVSALAYLFMLPGEVEDYAKSLISASFSVSNFYFWQQSGYFDAPATMKPLLHTWSLAVEEQFYVFFPLILMALYKFAWRRTRLSVMVLAAFSFAISVVETHSYPSANFYLAPSRAWELFVGSMIALGIVPQLRSKITRELGAAAGLLMVIYSAIHYTVLTPFPGVSALIPCLGAGLVIASGIRHPELGIGQFKSTFTANLLSLRPVVFVGLISYSLYLWHWPVIVFQTISPRLSGWHPLIPLLPFLSIAHAYIVERLLIIVGVSVLLATLSWKFIERPFRSGVLAMPRIALFRFFGAATACILVFGMVIVAFKGFPERFSPETLQVASYLSTLPNAPKGHYREHSCFLMGGDTFENFDQTKCLHIDPQKKNWLLIGDSHAAQLDYGFSGLKNINVMQATATGCKPVIAAKPGESASCVALNKFVFSEYLPKTPGHIDTLVIAARWDSEDLIRLGKTIMTVKADGIRVLLFGPIMEYDTPLPRLLAMSIQDKDPELAAKHRLRSYDDLDHEMKKMAHNVWKVDYISYEDLFCDSGRCLEYASKDIPLQSDTAHLTDAGSILVEESVKSLAE